MPFIKPFISIYVRLYPSPASSVKVMNPSANSTVREFEVATSH